MRNSARGLSDGDRTYFTVTSMRETANAQDALDEGARQEITASTPTSAEKLRLLMERVALVTRAHNGGATLLFTLGRIASSSRWIDDGFRVEIAGDDVESRLEIYEERGDTGELVVPPTKFAVPIDELVAAVDADPSLTGSLRVEVIESRRLLLMTRSSGVHQRFEGSTPSQAPGQNVYTKTTVPKMAAVSPDVIVVSDGSKGPRDPR